MPVLRLLALLVFMGVASASAHAAAPVWTIDSKASRLSFTAKQSGAPAEGGFSIFKGEIRFDPNDLATSRIVIDVDMASVTSSYADVATTLVTEPWFNSKGFPVARYTSKSITKEADGSYTVAGALSLRGIEAPVSLSFRFESYGPKTGDAKTLRAVAKGQTILMRTAFGVGQGEWKKTDTVADPVTVAFTIAAERPATP